MHVCSASLLKEQPCRNRCTHAPLRLLLLFVFSCIGVAASAQDTIVMRNGKMLQVKVVEVNPTAIAYRRFDYSDGPLFRIHKADISLILYQSGAVDSFLTLHSVPVDSLLIELRNEWFYQAGRML